MDINKEEGYFKHSYYHFVTYYINNLNLESLFIYDIRNNAMDPDLYDINYNYENVIKNFIKEVL